MPKLIIDRFGKDKLLSVSKRQRSGSSKTCMLLLVVLWTSSKWTQVAEEAKEMSSIQTWIQVEQPTFILSQLRMLLGQKTNMPTEKWIRMMQDKPYSVKFSTMTWNVRLTRSKSLASETRWIEMPTTHWWVKTCSTVWRERRQWKLWDLTGKLTSKIRSITKRPAQSLNEEKHIDLPIIANLI